MKRLFPDRTFRLCIGQYHTSIIDEFLTIYDFIIPSLDLPNDFLTDIELIEQDQIGFWWLKHVLQYRSDDTTNLIESLFFFKKNFNVYSNIYINYYLSSRDYI